MELERMYAGARARIMDLVIGLSPQQLGLPVPGTPDWTVADVVAHLAGVSSDLLNRRTDGASTEPWTARQVAERRGRPVVEILAEWDADAASIEPLISKVQALAPAAFDALTHEHDLRGAVGVEGASDPEMVEVALAASIEALGSRLDAAGQPGLRIVTGPEPLAAGSEAVKATVTATSFEMFRATFGRRGAGQIRTYDWDGDAAPYIEVFSLFGPVPAADVVEAGAPSSA
jgi:uncharacterized protein (TIGR03083 family)